jgi:hypothetical protein
METGIMEKVGALSVRCHCPVCNECLLERSILYLADKEISKEQAIRDELTCVFCGCKLGKIKRMIRR